MIKKQVFIQTKLHPLNLALASGIVAGLGLFFVTLVSSATGYGLVFLDMLKSVYPGFEVSGAGAFIGLVYAFIDAFVMFFFIAWVYNYFELKRQRQVNDMNVAK